MGETLQQAADRLINLAERVARATPEKSVIELINRIAALEATLQGAEAIMRRAEVANAQALQVIRAALDKDASK